MGKGGEEEDGGRLGKGLLGEMISQLGERRHKKEWFVVSWMTNDHFRGLYPKGEGLQSQTSLDNDRDVSSHCFY